MAPALAPRVLGLGNLFRDQLDRYGELEAVAARWRRISAAGPWRLVRNADDPLVAGLPGNDGSLSYGIDDPSVALPGLPHAADSKWCGVCGERLRYDAVYLGHLGAWACPACGNARPALDVSATGVAFDGLNGTGFTLRTPLGERRVNMPLPGLYNVYNALAAVAMACAMGDVALERMAAGLEAFGPAFGRFERVSVDGHEAVLVLSKNPAGANEVIRTLAHDPAPKRLVVALNDRIADGRDVSWIWDVDFELLAGRRGVGGDVGDAGRRDGRAPQVRRRRSRPRPRRAGPGGGARHGTDRGQRAGLRAHHLHGHARAARGAHPARGRAAVLGGRVTDLRVCHLYPEHLNIYADRGNIAVLRYRCERRGIGFEAIGCGPGDPLPEADLYYLGGGQDRDQVAIAGDLVEKSGDLRSAVTRGAAVLAVCGGYQLLGHGYRGHSGDEMPGTGLVDLMTEAGPTRMIGNITLRCELDAGDARTVVGFENHAGRTHLGPGVEPLGRVLHGHGNNGADGGEGVRAGKVIGTYVHGPLLPKNPWLADWLVREALEQRHGAVELDPLDDALELEAHRVAEAIAAAG